MKFLLGCLLVFCSVSTYAHVVSVTIEQGENAFVNNSDETLILVTCGKKAGANVDKVDLESGASFVATLGYEMIAKNDLTDQIEMVKAGHGVKINCK